MKSYLVGGAIRDRLLGLQVKERDFVVVGATPADMLAAGYRSVGKDFPVFLHPKTHEEYALARLERKTGRGYTAFEFMTAPTVTLEEDLLRRDLTINAIAENDAGQLIDPYHGIDDLQQRILRHVSPAFSEDPVRLLRIARFYARFADLGFVIAEETQQLLSHMVTQHEVDALVPERVWQETIKAFASAHPSYFFDVLYRCKALPVLFPEIALIWSQQNKNIQTCLDKAAANSLSLASRFASLVSFFPEKKALDTLSLRYPITTEFKELAGLMLNMLPALQTLHSASAETILNLLNVLDAFRRPERFQQLLNTLPCCQQTSADNIQKLSDAYHIASQHNSKNIVLSKTPPALRAQVIATVRVDALRTWLEDPH